MDIRMGIDRPWRHGHGSIVAANGQGQHLVIPKEGVGLQPMCGDDRQCCLLAWHVQLLQTSIP